MTAEAAPFRLTGLHVLGGIIAFFALVIGADVWFAVLAYRSFSGQVADNPYEAGILYNRTIEQRRAEAALGWTAQAEVANDAVILTFQDREGAPLEGLKVTAELVRPATEAGRISLSLKPAGDGAYRAAAPGLKGAWDVRARAVAPSGETFEIERRVTLHD